MSAGVGMDAGQNASPGLGSLRVGSGGILVCGGCVVSVFNSVPGVSNFVFTDDGY